MTLMTTREPRHLSDDELWGRTQELIRAARQITSELTLQTERLAETISAIEREMKAKE